MSSSFEVEAMVRGYHTVLFGINAFCSGVYYNYDRLVKTPKNSDAIDDGGTVFARGT